jgi:antitoxin (DNA-binding transcriptional repressor) of toxin-antitoxin stability system
MSDSTASVRELRTDFRGVKRKMEQHGEVVITNNGEPAYVLKPLPRKSKEPPPLPDYYARLIEQRSTPMSDQDTREFWEEERGGR